MGTSFFPKGTVLFRIVGDVQRQRAKADWQCTRRAASTKFWAQIPWMVRGCDCSRLSSVGTSRVRLSRASWSFTAIAAGFADDGDLGYFQEGRAQATLAALNSWNASTVAIIFGKA
jgi:hypothetical protein